MKIMRDAVIQDYKCADTYFIGIRLIMSQQEEGYHTFNLKGIITKFCSLIEVARVKKDLNDLRIIHIKQEELPRKLIHKY